MGELRRLDAWWQGARAGEQPALAVVAGESGVGKSRLVAEFAERVAASGALVLWGAASDHGFLPYEAWIAALRACLLDEHPELRATIVDRHRTQLAAVPWLRDLVPEGTASSLGAPDETAVADLVTETLCDLAGTDPVLVVLEDVQWCDRGSVELLATALASSIDRCAFVAVERRPTSVRSAWHELDLELGDRVEERVGRLGREACVRLTRSLLPVDASDALTDAICDGSGGNAFVALSLAALATGSVRARADLVERLPETAAQIWAARFAPLAPASHRVLEVAAVAGTAFDPSIVADAVADAVATDRAMEDARVAGLVVPAGEAGSRFAHALLREHVYRGLTRTRRQRVHRSLARALTARVGSEPSEVSAQVAHHWRHSGSSGAPAELEHTIRAARWALAQGAPDTAAELGDRALALIDRLAASQHLTAGALAARQAELGDLLLRLGHPRAVAVMVETAGYCESVDDLSTLARIADALLRAGEATGQPGAGTDLAERLIDRLDAVDPRVHSRILARLSRALEGRTGAVPFQSRVSRKALRLAREHGDDETLAIALFCHAADRPWTDDRLAQVAELVELAERRGNLEWELFARHYLCSLLVDRGDIDGADRVLAEVVELLDRIPPGYVGAIKNADLALEARVLTVIRLLHQAQLAGRFDDQQRLLDELGTYVGQPGLEQERLTVALLGQQCLLALDRGRIGELAPFMAAYAAEEPTSTQRAVSAAYVLAEAGDRDEARRFFNPFVTTELQTVPIDQTASFMLIALARTARLLDDRPGAALVSRALQPFSGRNSCFVGGTLGPVDLGLASCALVLEEVDRAGVLAERSIEQCRRMRAEPFLARASLVRAEVARAADDAAGAIRFAGDARTVAEKLGMPVVAARAAALARGEGA